MVATKTQTPARELREGPTPLRITPSSQGKEIFPGINLRPPEQHSTRIIPPNARHSERSEEPPYFARSGDPSQEKPTPSEPRNPHPTLDTTPIIETGGNTRKPTTPGHSRRAKYSLLNTLREVFFENKTFSPIPTRSPDLNHLLLILCAKPRGKGGITQRAKKPPARHPAVCTEDQ